MPGFSLPPTPVAPLSFAALSPPQPCSSLAPPLPGDDSDEDGLLACGRTFGQPKDGWRWSVDVVPGHDDEPAGRLRHEPLWIWPLRPSRELLLHSRQRLVLLEPPTPSLIGHQNRSAIYSCQCWLIRETCLDSSSLIDWLWFWLMGFVAPSLCE
jgi:hypothetical protein